MLDELGRDAAEQRASDGAAAVRAGDDQIGVLLIGKGDDRLHGRARDAFELVRDASVLSRLLERGLRLVHRLPMLDRDRRAETAGHELIRRKHVDECHFGLLLRGELESEGDCLLGVRRTVGGDDDLLHGSSFLDQDARGATARRHPEIRGLGVRISADKLNLVADRMRALLDAGIAISSELSLDSLLQKLAETAAELTAARYAALGVIDPSGRELERFLTHGIDPETHAAIGDLPRGRGILGVLIRDATPLRLPDLSADARSVGFPPHHPAMKTFVGVPILLRGMAYGNLYLTEKDGGAEFTEEDEEIVTLLASQAAVAIENARLYEAATRWSRQLESLNEVGNAMATEIEPQAILDLVARRLHALIDARILTIWLPTRNGKLRVDTVSGDGAEALLGLETDLSETKTGRVFRAARSARVDSVLDDPEIEHDVARQIGARAALWVPLLARGHAIGVIAAFDKAGNAHFSDADLRLCETFAERAALAVELSQRVARDALRRVVDAQELERRRLARELHDETGQALTSVLLGLKGCEEATSLDEVHAVSAHVRELVVHTLQDVRRLAVELRPKALDDFGLVAALERLTTGFAEQTGVAVELESRLADARLPSEIETVFYRIVQEALTNVVKHAQAEHVSIVLTPKDSSVTAVIEDDGRGFSPDGDGEGLGLVGMRERVALVDGRLEIESSEGLGTTILVEVPVQ